MGVLRERQRGKRTSLQGRQKGRDRRREKRWDETDGRCIASKRQRETVRERNRD